MDKEIKNEFHNLGRMIKRGFDDVDRRFEENKKEHQIMKVKLDDLENGQEEIKLKLDNVAYRFELNALEKRVGKLEFKLGLIKHQP